MRNRQPRVLMVTPRFPPDLGGVERHVWQVSRRLAARGTEVQILCTDRTGTRLGIELVDGVRVQRVRAWGAHQDHYFAPGLWTAIRKDAYDVVHVQSYHTFVAPIAMARSVTEGVPFVLTFHGGGHSSRLRHSLRRVQRLALRPLIRRAAALVAVAEFEVDSYGRELGIPGDRFRLIPNGVDVPLRLRQDVPNAPVIASIGRLESYKGHDKVIAAMPTVLADRPDTALWIIGTGSDERRLRRWAGALGVGDRVEFRSVANDAPEAMYELLERTSVAVSMSSFETQPISGLEAVAAGVPLVVADTSGLSELARRRLARPVAASADPQQLARAILAELGSVSPPAVPDLPTWDDTASDLLELYRDVTCAS